MKKIAILCAGLVLSASAQEQKYVPLQTILGADGMVFPKGRQRALITYNALEKKRFYEGGDETNDPKSVSADRKSASQQFGITYRRGYGDGWESRVMIPYIFKSQEQNHPDKIRREWDNSGVGDIPLVIRKEVLSQKSGDPIFLALGGGMKLPTGSTDKGFTKEYPVAQGGAYTTRQPMDLQMGSGSFDPLFEVGITKVISNARVDGVISYQYTTEGKNSYEFGDVLKYVLGYTYMVHPNVDIEAGLIGNIAQKDKLDGNELNNKGGHTVFGELGFHLKLDKQFDISAAYLVPVYKNVNGGSGGSGKNAYPGGQGVEDSRVMVRVGIDF